MEIIQERGKNNHEKTFTFNSITELSMGLLAQQTHIGWLRRTREKACKIRVRDNNYLTIREHLVFHAIIKVQSSLYVQHNYDVQ